MRTGLAKVKNQVEINLDIEAFILEKDAKGESYSQADIDFINLYEGSGGQGSKGATGEGLLYEFYTPDYVVDLMWELALRHGYEGGTVLEPSCATGRLFRPAKDHTRKGNQDCVGFEINPTSARIAEITYPGCIIYNHYFETAFLQPPLFRQRLIKLKKSTMLTDPHNKKVVYSPGWESWLLKYPFSLVIGNPPYGIYKNKYSSYFPDASKLRQIEIFFMYYGMKLLQKDGLLIYLTSSSFMRNHTGYLSGKQLLAEITDFVDAYRLPKVFRFSDVPTDILIFRRK